MHVFTKITVQLYIGGNTYLAKHNIIIIIIVADIHVQDRNLKKSLCIGQGLFRPGPRVEMGMRLEWRQTG